MNETDFGKVVKDRKIGMLELKRNFKKIQNAYTKIKMYWYLSKITLRDLVPFCKWILEDLEIDEKSWKSKLASRHQGKSNNDNGNYQSSLSIANFIINFKFWSNLLHSSMLEIA